VTRQFLASLCADAHLRVGHVEITAGGEVFSLASLEIIDEGWCAALPSATTRRQPPNAQALEPVGGEPACLGCNPIHVHVHVHVHVCRYAALPHRAPQPQPLPRVREGQRLPIASLRVEAGTTEPPPPLSESDLISEMENNGIGTDASIATHIKNVEARKYVRLLAGRRLEPTALGLALVQG